MGKMIERAAAALRTEFEEMFDARLSSFATAALVRAVLAAIREPSEEMVLAGMCAKPEHTERDNTLARHQRITGCIFTAMIDAALSEDV